ncbi:MAG: LacI family transcriptional regulator [Lentisphaerae bacterium]|nr:LacI family transcriptional regulator [Lentisphaerota bacterium]
MSERPSIRDVAKAAGVSHTTVSLALRGDPRIPPASRRRIERAAAETGYRRNACIAELMAQLRTIRTRPDTSTLGFITAWPARDGWQSSPNQRRFFDGVQARAGALGYRVETFWLREPGMTSRRMSSILRTRGIRGLILQSLPKAHGHLSLEWRHFAAVAKGLTISRPRLHRVTTSHFEDMRLVVHHLKRHGYRRPGLVLDADLDARTDQAWTAAYLLDQQQRPARERIPALVLESDREGRRFAGWFARHRPDAILFSRLPVPSWLASAGIGVPADVGLVHLDWSPEASPLAGIDADPEAAGAAAVDLLVGQLHANEHGIPAREKIVAVRGRWVPGASLRAAQRT